MKTVCDNFNKRVSNRVRIDINNNTEYLFIYIHIVYV